MNTRTTDDELDKFRLRERPTTPEEIKGVDAIPDLPPLIQSTHDTILPLPESFPDTSPGDEGESVCSGDTYMRFRRFNESVAKKGIYRKNRPRAPVKSCGLICYNEASIKEARRIGDVDRLRVLMVRRKDSLAFVEFMRGKYKPSDPMYVRTLLRGMTRDEHRKLKEMEFDTLWFDMWKTMPARAHIQEYLKSKGRFDECKEDIRRFLNDNPEEGVAEPEWTFPKGRPNRDETTFTCAMREFTEESGISSTLVKLINRREPMIEVYTGTNGILYQNVFYIGVTSIDEISLDSLNTNQQKEISGIEWVSPSEGMDRMRHTYPSREHIMREVSRRILIEKE